MNKSQVLKVTTVLLGLSALTLYSTTSLAQSRNNQTTSTGQGSYNGVTYQDKNVSGNTTSQTQNGETVSAYSNTWGYESEDTDSEAATSSEQLSSSEDNYANRSGACRQL